MGRWDVGTKWLSDRVTKWTSDRVTKWPSDWVSEWPSDRVTEWPSHQVTEWPSDRVTKWPSDQVTKWLNDWMTAWLSDQVTKWQVTKWQKASQTIDRMVYLSTYHCLKLNHPCLTILPTTRDYPGSPSLLWWEHSKHYFDTQNTSTSYIYIYSLGKSHLLNLTFIILWKSFSEILSFGISSLDWTLGKQTKPTCLQPLGSWASGDNTFSNSSFPFRSCLLASLYLI